MKTLFDYLEAGDTLDEILRQFPSVRRDQAVRSNSLATPFLPVRVLPDENLPLDLAKPLPGHEVTTVHALGWDGMKNGDYSGTSIDHDLRFGRPCLVGTRERKPVSQPTMPVA